MFHFIYSVHSPTPVDVCINLTNLRNDDDQCVTQLRHNRENQNQNINNTESKCNHAHSFLFVDQQQEHLRFGFCL